MEKSLSLITAIIPVFNRQEVIERSIRSVLAQTRLPLELLVVDDASTDRTCEIVERCFASHQTSVLCRLIRLEKNQGVSNARNLAAREAQGSWLAFLDSDDEWLPEKLAWQWQKHEENALWPLIHGEEIWIRRGTFVNQKKIHKKSGGDQFERSLQLCVISPSATLLKKSVFFELGGFDNDFPVCEDYDLWLKLTSLYEIGFVDLPIIKKYGGHEDQLSHAYRAMDYWRVLSQMRIYKLRPELSSQKKQTLLQCVLEKSAVLLAGFEKHKNLEHYEEIAAAKDWAQRELSVFQC